MDISVDNKSKARVCQRTVAAINFLSNIRVEGEEDDEVPGYNCLQGTEVLDTYRRQSRIRRKVPYKRGVKRKDGVGASTSRERTPEVEACRRVTNDSFRRRNPESAVKNKSVEGVKSRKQLLSEDACKMTISMESVNDDRRQRQTSGTLSDHSHSSNRVCSIQNIV